MATHVRQLGYDDRARLNVNEDWERRYWTTQFQCSDAQLRAAVNVVGPFIDAVRSYLQQQRN